jgi:hypothetical protein
MQRVRGIALMGALSSPLSIVVLLLQLSVDKSNHTLSPTGFRSETS